MGGKILVIEKEQKILDLCKDTLSQKGYAVTTAQSVKEGLSQIKQEEFDILLTQLQFSERNVYDFLDHVHEIQSDLSSIIITEQADIQKALHTLHLGAQGILLKPFTNQELSQCVEDALEKNRLVKENVRLKLLLPLFEISHGCIHHEDLDGLLRTTSNVLKRELKASSTAIFLNDRQTQELVLRLEDDLPEQKEHLLSMAEWVAEREETLILVDQSPSDPFFEQIILHYQLSSALGFPIRGKQGIVGILIVLRKLERNKLSQTDIEFITILLNHLAIAIDNNRLFNDLEESHFEAIRALADALETKDAYTRGHSDRTVDFAADIAKQFGLSPEETEHIKYAAILHDIGKIGIPESILNKPGPLTEEEFEVMKKHPELGSNIVKQIKFLAPVAPLIFHHQERFDGKGYPIGLSGDAIPMGSRIIAVLDAFDAMTSDRVYRKAPGKVRAIAELKQFSGTQFDPQVVAAFLNLLEEN
ncbi:MAG TPA: HD domain-containing phosphohydrolase [Nitrospiria bacterium]